MAKNSRLKRQSIFVGLEALLFFLFWESLNPSFSVLPFYLYIGIFPVILVTLVYISDVARNEIKSLLLSKDMIIFFSVVAFWLYIYALEGLSITYAFSTLYFPVLIEELNFRFIITNYLTEIMPLSKAVVIQAFLYALFYSGYLVMEPGSYPGLYLPLFLIDMIAVGLIYGGIYFFRKNVYIDMSIHASLWLMAAVVPSLLIWIPYTMAPT